MTLTFDQFGVEFLDFVLRRPLVITQNAPGTIQWKAKDEIGSRQVIQLQHWMEKKVLTKVAEDNYTAPKSGWTGALPKIAVDRLREIVRHYESCSGFVGFADRYYSALDSIEGKRCLDADDLVAYVEPETDEAKK